MKKTLIASAIAAATFASGAAFAAGPTVSGNIQLAYTYTDYDNGDTDSKFDDNGSTIRFEHSHEVSPGLTAFARIELEGLELDDKADSNGISALDEAYIGLKGDFGAVQIGSDDTVYEWVDVVDIGEAVGVSGDLASMQEGDNLQYTSPKLGGMATVGVTLKIQSEESDENHVGALAVKASPVENLNVILGYAAAANDGDDTLGLAATYSMDNITLGAQYENQDDVDLFGLMGRVTMGANSLAAAVVSVDNGSTDATDFHLQALHNLSDNMYVYGEFATMNDGDDSQYALGATYVF